MRHVNLHFKAFLENHSCQTALIRLVDDWISAVDKNEVVGTLLLDLSKAFDLVNHSLLLQNTALLWIT